MDTYLDILDPKQKGRGERRTFKGNSHKDRHYRLVREHYIYKSLSPWQPLSFRISDLQKVQREGQTRGDSVGGRRVSSKKSQNSHGIICKSKIFYLLVDFGVKCSSIYLLSDAKGVLTSAVGFRLSARQCIPLPDKF